MPDTISDAFTTPKRLVPQQRHPITEAIKKRAYDLFLVRGGGNGHDLDDWLQAEQELLDATRSHVRDIKGGTTAGKHSA